MARSKAARARKHAVRAGKRDPQQDRLGWNGIRPVERMTPTLKEKRGKLESKYKPKWNRSFAHGDGDGSISFHPATALLNKWQNIYIIYKCNSVVP